MHGRAAVAQHSGGPVNQSHKDPVPVPGVHLVKTTSREEDSMASDVVDILTEGLRGSTDTDVGGVEQSYLTTLAKDEAKRTEFEFMQALAHRIRERCPWANGADGLRVRELGNRDGWKFSVTDREGRPYAVEITFSEIYEVARVQRNATLSNFPAILDSVANKLNITRADYFSRRDAAVISS